MQDAQDAFHDAMYIVSEGVQGFYDILLDHAQDMAIYLDEFTIQECFLEGIPFHMLVVLICDGGLASEVNIIEEFMAKAKAYKNSIKTAAHYLEHSLRQHGRKITSLAAVQSSRLETILDKHSIMAQSNRWMKTRGVSPGSASKNASISANCYKCGKQSHFVRECKELAKPPQGYICAVHTAALTEINNTINNTNDEQVNEPEKEEAEQASQNSEEDEVTEEYVELDAYKNEYYTHDSNSKALGLYRLLATYENRNSKHR
ncbi:hypothetical protein C0995_012002 [Termitomyces sp. Mi166|nr:hypothetical protein C0995_012002 [Termitomyces sp. Mi166\